jgi:hypothetical protein
VFAVPELRKARASAQPPRPLHTQALHTSAQRQMSNSYEVGPVDKKGRFTQPPVYVRAADAARALKLGKAVRRMFRRPRAKNIEARRYYPERDFGWAGYLVRTVGGAGA